MTTRKKLGPPKGAGATADAALAVLGSRFSDPEPTPPAAAPPPAVRPTPAPAVSPRPVERRRKPATNREPEGMTRQTYYLSAAAAADLEDAVRRVRAATGGLVTKHQALGALIAAGAAQADEVARRLRAELATHLTNDADVSHTRV